MDRQAANSRVEASEVWIEKGRDEQQVFHINLANHLDSKVMMEVS